MCLVEGVMEKGQSVSFLKVNNNGGKKTLSHLKCGGILVADQDCKTACRTNRNQHFDIMTMAKCTV